MTALLVLLVVILHKGFITDFFNLLLKLALVVLLLNNGFQVKLEISGNFRLQICQINDGIDQVKRALFVIFIHIFRDHEIMLVYSFLSWIDVVELFGDVMS